jgi:transcription elongation GreA/GreB family factor
VPEEMIGNEPPDSSPDEAEERLRFHDMERRLKLLEDRIAYAKTYDEVLLLRGDLGSKGRQSQLLKDMQEAGPDKRLISGPEYKALCKTWARCDRQLEKLEAKLRPSAEDSFMDPPDDERQPGVD